MSLGEMPIDYGTGSLPSSELNYLQKFYDATQGPHWNVNHTFFNEVINEKFWRINKTMGVPWNFTNGANPCTDNWLGVTCNVTDGSFHVIKLVLPFCNLTGSIPENINDLTYLSDFNLRNNAVTGSIPNLIGDLSLLRYFVLYENQMTGTLPDSISNLSALREMDLSGNSFHGTIPESFGQLSHLVYLYVLNNKLSGHIPPALGKLHRLFILNLASNSFDGPIPESFGNLTRIREIILNDNYLTGPMPTNWANYSIVDIINLSGNYLTGTISATFRTHAEIEYFIMNNNLFTGTIPEELGNFTSLEAIDLFANLLTGTVPQSFANLHRLTNFSVEYNFLSGSLHGVFNATKQTRLTSLTVNNNQFTGAIPDEVFRLPELHLFIAAVNCFTESLTDSICTGYNLTTVSIDGPNTAPACRRPFLSAFSSAYVPKYVSEAQLPSCVFQMPKLETLHLSANGLTGTLPADIVISPRLTVLALSHNILTGSIPTNFQVHPWSSLYLAYNKLGGTMQSDLGRNASSGAALPMALHIANNRISGGVPPSVRALVNVSVLGTNLVHCDLSSSDLPQQDSDSNKYTCGSTSFEVPYYVWMCIVGVFGVALASARRHHKFWGRYAAVSRGLAYLRVWFLMSNGTYDQLKVSTKSVAIVNRVFLLLCRTSLLSLAYIMVVLLPLYVALGYYYKTLTHSYAYFVSAAYMSGVLPAALICFALLGLLVLFVLFFVRHLPKYTTEERQVRNDSRSSRNLSNAQVDVASNSVVARLRNMLVYVAFTFANLAVVVGVNYLYIYAVVYQSNEFLLISQICVAFFKLVWSGSGIHALVKVTTSHLMMDPAEKSDKAEETRLIMIQILLTLLNNIVVPCMVVAAVSENCYYYVFVSAPNVITDLSYKTCVSVVMDHCTEWATGSSSVSFTPPYKYDYQCSASIVAIYAPAYVALCIMTAFGVPIVELLASRWFRRAAPESYWYRFLKLGVPFILRPIDVLNEEELKVQPDRYFPVNQMLVVLINLLGMLLTFGAVFPPLAVALAFTLVAVTVFAKLKLGRFLCNAITKRRLNYVDLIEAECQRAGAVTVLYRSAWILIVISCFFYTFFIFDTLGDAVGFTGAFWVLIVLPLVPAAIFALFTALSFLLGATAEEKANEFQRRSDTVVEMVDMKPAADGGTNFDDNATVNALLGLFGDGV